MIRSTIFGLHSLLFFASVFCAAIASSWKEFMATCKEIKTSDNLTVYAIKKPAMDLEFALSKEMAANACVAVGSNMLTVKTARKKTELHNWTKGCCINSMNPTGGCEFYIGLSWKNNKWMWDDGTGEYDRAVGKISISFGEPSPTDGDCITVATKTFTLTKKENCKGNAISADYASVVCETAGTIVTSPHPPTTSSNPTTTISFELASSTFVPITSTTPPSTSLPAISVSVLPPSPTPASPFPSRSPSTTSAISSSDTPSRVATVSSPAAFSTTTTTRDPAASTAVRSVVIDLILVGFVAVAVVNSGNA